MRENSLPHTLSQAHAHALAHGLSLALYFVLSIFEGLRLSIKRTLCSLCHRNSICSVLQRVATCSSVLQCIDLLVQFVVLATSQSCKFSGGQYTPPLSRRLHFQIHVSLSLHPSFPFPPILSPSPLSIHSLSLSSFDLFSLFRFVSPPHTHIHTFIRTFSSLYPPPPTHKHTFTQTHSYVQDAKKNLRQGSDNTPQTQKHTHMNTHTHTHTHTCM